MKPLKVAFTVVVAALFFLATVTVNCPAEENPPPTTEVVTKHPPGHRATPQKKISKSPKWPWVVAGGLAVALLAIFLIDDSGSSPQNGDGNVSYEW